MGFAQNEPLILQSHLEGGKILLMPQNKVKIIVNPNADLGRAWRTASDLRAVVDELGGADWAGSVYPRHATELARQAGEEGYRLVIAAGGDGTVHEVMNGLMQFPAERRPQMGVVPIGTGNDFAFAVGMNKEPALAIRQVLQGTPRAVDIGLMHDQLGRTIYWDNTIGIGFDATVTIRSRKISFLRGFPLYLAAVLQTIALNHTAPRMEVKTDRESWTEETLLLAVCNSGREGGGFMLAPGAKNNDGVLNYTRIRNVSRPTMLRILPEVLKGTHAHFSSISMGELTRMELKSNAPLLIHADGEIYAGFGSNIRSLQIEMLPGALQVVA